MKLAILIPTMGVEEELTKCLESIENYAPDAEVFIGCDNVGETLDFLDKDKYYIDYHTENVGVGLTRRKLLTIALSLQKYDCYLMLDENSVLIEPLTLAFKAMELPNVGLVGAFPPPEAPEDDKVCMTTVQTYGHFQLFSDEVARDLGPYPGHRYEEDLKYSYMSIKAGYQNVLVGRVGHYDKLAKGREPMGEPIDREPVAADEQSWRYEDGEFHPIANAKVYKHDKYGPKILYAKTTMEEPPLYKDQWRLLDDSRMYSVFKKMGGLEDAWKYFLKRRDIEILGWY